MVRRIKVKDIVLCTCGCILLIFLAFFIIISSINFKENNEKPVMLYNNNNKLNYLVYLKNENNNPEYLEEGNQYISSLINYINVDYKYSLSSLDAFDYEYSYKISAIVTANHEENNDSKNILTNEYVIKESDKYKNNGSSSIDIKENFNFNYQEYNDYIKEFQKNYTLNFDANVILKIEVFINGKYENQDINEDMISELTMPLLNSTFSIEKNEAKSENKVIMIPQNKSRIKSIIVLIMGTILMTLGLILLVLIILTINRLRKQNKYYLTVKKYLKDYNDIIIHSSLSMDEINKKIEDVDSLEELVNIENELHIPITYIEVNKNKEAWFIIISNNKIWRYKFINNIDNK